MRLTALNRSVLGNNLSAWNVDESAVLLLLQLKLWSEPADLKRGCKLIILLSAPDEK